MTVEEKQAVCAISLGKTIDTKAEKNSLKPVEMNILTLTVVSDCKPREVQIPTELSGIFSVKLEISEKKHTQQSRNE